MLQYLHTHEPWNLNLKRSNEIQNGKRQVDLENRKWKWILGLLMLWCNLQSAAKLETICQLVYEVPSRMDLTKLKCYGIMPKR